MSCPSKWFRYAVIHLDGVLGFPGLSANKLLSMARNIINSKSSIFVDKNYWGPVAVLDHHYVLFSFRPSLIIWSLKWFLFKYIYFDYPSKVSWIFLVVELKILMRVPEVYSTYTLVLGCILVIVNGVEVIVRVALSCPAGDDPPPAIFHTLILCKIRPLLIDNW